MEDIQQKHTLQFTGTGQEYFKIWIVNSILTLLTVGIYSAWASVRTKRYFYSNTLLKDHPFHYDAQPQQLVMGHMLALVFLVALVFLIKAGSIEAIFLLFVIMPWFIYRHLSLNARMTGYNNVSFNLQQGILPFYQFLFLYPLMLFLILALIAMSFGFFEGSSNLMLDISLFAVLSLYLSYPWAKRNIMEYMINHASYGQETFLTKPPLSTLKYYVRYGVPHVIPLLIALLMSLILGYLLKGAESTTEASEEGMMFFKPMLYGFFFFVLLISKAYIQSGIRGHVFAHMKLTDRLAFESTATTRPVFILLVTNALLLLISVGLAYPWTKIRSARFFAQHTHVYEHPSTGIK